MMVEFGKELQIILTALQLTLFAILGLVSVYKILLSKKNQAQFLLVFYLFALLDILVYITLTVYQIVRLIFDEEIHLVVLVMINIFSMILQIILLFLLSFYWKQTEAMLRGSGIDSQQSISNVKNELKFKGVCLTLWFLIYTAFLLYSLISNIYLSDAINQNIFYFGGQGFSTLLLIWANLSQIISARAFSFTLKRYQSLVSYSMNKGKFRCIYWVSSTINFLRLVYIITATILFRILNSSESAEWLAMLIYTASGTIPLAIYLYSFQINQKKKKQSLQSFSSSQDNSHRHISGLYEPPKIGSPDKQKSKNFKEGSYETELSNSYDSHGI